VIERRKPLKRGKLPKRTALKRAPWIRSSSPAKRTTMKKARPKDRLATWCEAQTEKCTGRAEIRHHKRGRGKPGDDDREHTLDVCDACHRWIHAHPRVSYERGWMEKRT
jgi:hypothetical protein